MRIAVLTWFRDMNYGTILQALALQMYLRSKGHDSELVNYLPVRKGTIDNHLTFFERVNRKIDFLCTNKYKQDHEEIFRRKTKKFYNTIDDNCAVSVSVSSDEDFKNIGKEYDMYICGSDQIWNPYWFEPHFFLDFVASGKLKVAYAPSLGIYNLPKEFHQLFKEYLSSFDGLSVREAEMAVQLSNIVGRQITNVCDPVFLLDKDTWTSMSGQKPLVDRPYIFYYLLSYNRNHWKAIIDYARRRGLDVVGIPIVGRQFYVLDGEKHIDASPLDFINYINHAECIFTDSFHATSFAVLLGKQFYTFERFQEKSAYSQNSRVKNLLTKVNLLNRIMKHNSKCIIQKSDIDYNKISGPLYEYISQSANYLNTFLGSKYKQRQL